jgi:predicted metal-dependent hydrolase
MKEPLPTMVELPVGPTRVEWRHSDRATRMSLKIDQRAGCVVVTLPQNGSPKRAMDWVRSQKNWISERIASLPEAVELSDGSTVQIHGVPHRIRHVPQARGGAWIEDGELRVAGAPEFLRRRVTDFLYQEAGRRLVALVAEKTAKIGVKAQRVTIKDTTSRWGSCASDGSLAFSWRLVMAPDYVQDYVAAHEVAHLRHMNHSPFFWALVGQLTEHTEAAMTWLEKEGSALHRVA